MFPLSLTPGRMSMRGSRLLALLALPSRRRVRRLHDRTLHGIPSTSRLHRHRDLVPDLRNRIAVFAHDSMQGRRTGTPGNAKGNAYIVSELQRIGLRPAGDAGGFLQRVPLPATRPTRPRPPCGRARASWRCGPTTTRTRRSSSSRPADQRLVAGVHRRPVGCGRDTLARGAAGEGGGLQQRVQRQQPRRAGPESDRAGWD